MGRSWVTDVTSAVTRVVLLAAVVVGAGFLLAASAVPAVPAADRAVETVTAALLDVPPLPARLADPAERSIVLDRHNRVIAVLHGPENREVVALDDIPLRVRNAVLATEDADFYSHAGVSWASIGRALAGNVTAGEVTSGASTITQQLVRNLVLRDRSVTYRRKAKEAVLAVRLERQLSKDEILERYLNLVYFGSGVYGIATASEYYFGVPVAELTVDQAALLAGVIRAPLGNDPFDNPRAARQRRNIVLAQMAEAGFLDPSRVRPLQQRPAGLRPRPPRPRRESLWITYVRELLKREPALGATVAERDDRVLRGGLTIYTTLNGDVQRNAERAIRKVLLRDEGPQAAVVAVSPRTGRIRALASGPRPFGRGEGATLVTPAVPGLGSPFGRQPGSSFKTFALVAALESGIAPSFTFPAGSSYTFDRDCGTQEYDVGNYADADSGTLDMVDGIARSSNTYFAHLADRLGPERIVDTAERMGIRSPLRGYCSTVLGSEEVFALDMATAYATLANDGVRCQPYAIRRIVDREGRVLMRRTPTCAEAVEPETAAVATELLRGPIEAGTASLNGQIGRPAAGKTGTTDDYGDAWFVGFVPQLSAAVWVGNEKPAQRLIDRRCSSGLVTGGCLPTMIWSRFMRASLRDRPVRDFPEPPPPQRAPVPDVVDRRVRDGSALLDAAGFTVIRDRVTDYREPGTIVAQQPPAGALQDVGAEVVVSVSDGTGQPPLMPDLVGLTVAEADAVLTDLGLVAEVFDVAAPPSQDGRVVSQHPPAGAVLDDGTSLRVHVGEAPEAPPPPADGDGDPDAGGEETGPRGDGSEGDGGGNGSEGEGGGNDSGNDGEGGGNGGARRPGGDDE